MTEAGAGGQEGNREPGSEAVAAERTEEGAPEAQTLGGGGWEAGTVLECWKNWHRGKRSTGSWDPWTL